MAPSHKCGSKPQSEYTTRKFGLFSFEWCIAEVLIRKTRFEMNFLRLHPPLRRPIGNRPVRTAGAAAAPPREISGFPPRLSKITYQVSLLFKGTSKINGQRLGEPARFLSGTSNLPCKLAATIRFRKNKI